MNYERIPQDYTADFAQRVFPESESTRYHYSNAENMYSLVGTCYPTKAEHFEAILDEVTDTIMRCAQTQSETDDENVRASIETHLTIVDARAELAWSALARSVRAIKD